MKYDLIIVGGGILGLFHAYHAAVLKKKVLIIEKDGIASGSSVQNFGQIVPSGLSGIWLDYGLKTLEIYQKLMKEADLSLVRNGSIYVASDDEELMLISEMENIHTSKGIECEMFTKDALLRNYPFLDGAYAQAGLFYKNDMSVNPRLFVHNLLGYLKEKLEVHTKFGHSVIGVEERSYEVDIITADRKKYTAEKVIICNGYIVNTLFSDIFLESGMELCKLQMLRTRPITQVKMQSNILTGLTIRRYESFQECPSMKNLRIHENYKELISEGIHILFKQEADGSIIIGDSHHYASLEKAYLLDHSSKDEIDELILNEAGKIVNFDLGAIDCRWTGRYLQHKDGIFEKSVTSNIEICTGIGGKGMSSGAGLAKYRIRKTYNL